MTERNKIKVILNIIILSCLEKEDDVIKEELKAEWDSLAESDKKQFMGEEYTFGSVIQVLIINLFNIV